MLKAAERTTAAEPNVGQNTGEAGTQPEPSEALADIFHWVWQVDDTFQALELLGHSFKGHEVQWYLSGEENHSQQLC